MRGLVALCIACAGMHAQVLLGLSVASAPSAPRLFNDGLWRGAAAGVEIAVRLPLESVLFDLPLFATLGTEYVRASASPVALLDDYRGWIFRASLMWSAGQGTAPFLRLGTGATLGERYRRNPPQDTAVMPAWYLARAPVVFWGLGVRGVIAASLGWSAEIECLTGDELGLLFPVRLGVTYRWGVQ